MDQRPIGSRVAFFGGSFDPPHLGHLAVARAAQAALGLDTVLFAPVGAQPLKPHGSTASFEDRLAMTRLAIVDQPGFILSMADAPKAHGAPNFTIETLLALRAELPPGGEISCLMGADSFAGLKRWHRAAEIPFAAPLIVASRPGERLADLKAQLPEGVVVESELLAEERRSSGAKAHVDSDDVMRGINPLPPFELSFCREEIEVVRYILKNSSGDLAPLYLLPGLKISISASEIREQLRLREPESTFLPAPVLDYIRANNLYRDLLPPG
jgi:nicotinate-nucleotide adenylyltransferase